MKKFTLPLTLLIILLSIGISFAEMVSLPKTGQITSYATGDDGNLQVGTTWPEPRFTDNSNGTITDNLTGMMWTKNADPVGSEVSWQNALNYVTGMNSGTYSNYGHTDWRLPNIIELLSLIDHEHSSPALSSNHPFTNLNSNNYYCSSTDVSYYSNHNSMWVIMFLDGSLGASSKVSNIFRVWPVRGDSNGVIRLPKTGQTTSYATGDDGDLQKGVACPNPRFNDNSDGTVNDNFTGLMWTKQISLGSNTWQNALNRIAGMNSGTYSNYSYTDWRLPNVNEIRSVINLGVGAPALISGYPFTSVPGAGIWSSTTRASSSAAAWFPGVWYGEKYYTNKTNGESTWAVRTIGFKCTNGSFLKSDDDPTGGECVPYVRYETGIRWSDFNGDADTTFQQAVSHGYHTGSTPKVSAIIVFDRSSLPDVGHVGIVSAINENDPNDIWIQDSNWYNNGVVHNHEIPDITQYDIKGYIYCKP